MENQENNNKYIVYAHWIELNGVKKYYVGMCQDINKRWHKNGTGYKKSIFGKAIEKYGWNSFHHEILDENLSKTEAEEKESYYVKLYHAWIGYGDSGGFNCTIDGKKTSKKSVVQIDVNTYKIINVFNSILEAAKSVSGSYDIWATKTNIVACCKEKVLTCCGYYWCYLEKYSDEWRPRADLRHSRIYQLNEQREIIKTWDSIGDASLELGITRMCISGVCNRRLRIVHGMFFCYEEDYNESWAPIEVNYRRDDKIICIETQEIFNDTLSISKTINRTQGAITRAIRHHSACNGKHYAILRDFDPTTWKPYINPHNKKIYQIEHPEIIYNTVKEAAKLTNIDISTIYGSLNYGKATKGVHWKYYNSDNSSVEEHEV